MSRENQAVDVAIASFSSVLTTWINDPLNALILDRVITDTISEYRQERHNRVVALGEPLTELPATESALENVTSMAANCARFAYAAVANTVLLDQSNAFSAMLIEIKRDTARKIFLELQQTVLGGWEVAAFAGVSRPCLKTMIVAKVTEAFYNHIAEPEPAFDYVDVDNKSTKGLTVNDFVAKSRRADAAKAIREKIIDPLNISQQAQKIYQGVLSCIALLQEQQEAKPAIAEPR